MGKVSAGNRMKGQRQRLGRLVVDERIIIGLMWAIFSGNNKAY